MKSQLFLEVHIRFLDHTEGNPKTQGLAPCDARGVLSNEDQDAYYLTSWICDDQIDEVNNLVFTISKKDVLYIRVLKQASISYPNGKKRVLKYEQR